MTVDSRIVRYHGPSSLRSMRGFSGAYIFFMFVLWHCLLAFSASILFCRINRYIAVPVSCPMALCCHVILLDLYLNFLHILTAVASCEFHSKVRLISDLEMPPNTSRLRYQIPSFACVILIFLLQIQVVLSGLSSCDVTFSNMTPLAPSQMEVTVYPAGLSLILGTAVTVNVESGHLIDVSSCTFVTSGLLSLNSGTSTITSNFREVLIRQAIFE
jgi:hypothetical protein